MSKFWFILTIISVILLNNTHPIGFRPKNVVKQVIISDKYLVACDHMYVYIQSLSPNNSFLGKELKIFKPRSDNAIKIAWLRRPNLIVTHISDGKIWLYNIDGEMEDLLVNEIGSYDGSTLVNMGGYGVSSGIYYINVEADGNWNVDIQYI